jgi:hypothetical protein
MLPFTSCGTGQNLELATGKNVFFLSFKNPQSTGLNILLLLHILLVLLVTLASLYSETGKC